MDPENNNNFSLYDETKFTCTESKVSRHDLSSQDTAGTVKMLTSTEDDEGPEAAALRNSVILRAILRSPILTTHDIKSIRLTSSTCCLAATAELIRRDLLEVRLRYYGNRFYRDSKNKQVMRSLEDSLQSLILIFDAISKHRFPATSFTFIGGTLSCPDLQNFFATPAVGHGLKSLCLLPDRDVTESSQKIFQNILCNLAPKIEKLMIGSGLAYTHWDDPQIEKMCLPHLKCVELSLLGKANETTEAVLKSAPNLERIERVSMETMDVVLDAGKAHAVKELRQVCLDLSRLGQVTKFANQNPALHTFAFTWLCNPLNLATDYQTTANATIAAINRILKSSQNTLKEVEIGHLPGVQTEPKLTVPKLPKLNRLVLTTLSMDECGWPALRVNFEWDYPNLKCLALLGDVFHFRQDQLLNTILTPGRHIWARLETLEVASCVDSKSLEQLLSSCLVLKCLRVHCHKEGSLRQGDRIGSFLSLLFSLTPKLDTLELTVESLDKSWGSLDPKLIGVEFIDCVRLAEEMKELAEEEKNAKEIRAKILKLRNEGPWLGSIVGLRHFKINFGRVTDLAKIKNGMLTPQPPFSRLSGLGAFQPLAPNLQVTIGYNFGNCDAEAVREILEPIAEFVNIVHWRAI